MKKICVVTAARSEYGLLRWTIDAIYHDQDLELQLVVTGAHLSPEQGLTYKFIEEDGYPIKEKIPMLFASDDEVSIAKSMGLCSISIADVYNRLKPDIVIVLGDRYELLPIVGTAVVMRIPIAHIGGGDVTEGAIDDEVRNAVTMMSTLHFPGVEDAAKNIIRMIGTDKDVYLVGETGLENFERLYLWNKDETARNLNLDICKKWCLVTLHPETKLSVSDNLEMAHNLYEAMSQTEGIQYVITKANADIGGSAINEFWSKMVEKNSSTMQLYSSLGQLRYLSLMKYASMVAGNSSSGIVETPFMGTPTINIGNRQKGRHICPNVICCGREKEDIIDAFRHAPETGRKVDYYWGDGKTSEKIKSIIKKYLEV